MIRAFASRHDGAAALSLTIQQKHSAEGIVKAGEMIEIRQSSDLSLQDRRILNVLIEHAGSQISSDEPHRVPMARLRGRHKGAERVRDSIIRLMTTMVEVPANDSKGNAATLRATILAETTTTDDEDNPTGEVSYSFSKTMRRVIEKSSHWGRIKAIIMFSFTSKYSLALYELLCLRANLRKTSEQIDLERFRALLGVPADKLTRPPDFLRRVVNPAVEEINGLTDFTVDIYPIRRGGPTRGKLIAFELKWSKKSDTEWRHALDELMRSKVGRRARIQGKTEEVVSMTRIDRQASG